MILFLNLYPTKRLELLFPRMVFATKCHNVSNPFIRSIWEVFRCRFRCQSWFLKERSEGGVQKVWMAALRHRNDPNHFSSPPGDGEIVIRSFKPGLELLRWAEPNWCRHLGCPRRAGLGAQERANQFAGAKRSFGRRPSIVFNWFILCRLSKHVVFFHAEGWIHLFLLGVRIEMK